MATLALTIAGVAGSTKLARAQDAVTGNIDILAADPGDFVIQLDKAGRCGSKYFHIQRTSGNFKETVALALTAFATNKVMVVFVTGCANDRNIISHGYAGR
ncbi:hypothetical protein CIT26_03800 [Mesorhizobium temperatum]|uniref:Uncharacterized protein n=1 Tax=Mesorhizobium temperatum TaxID=241416 RepID=A0A271LU38_9HYPH|nr:hypothetical protein CIT26_03800 [Mesorhizobium temperatum]